MVAFKECLSTLRTTIAEMIVQSRQWLDSKTKVKKESAPKTSVKANQAQKEPAQHGIDIGPPTDFRRADITLGTDCAGHPVLVEQAREDAQSIYYSAPESRAGDTGDVKVPVPVR